MKSKIGILGDTHGAGLMATLGTILAARKKGRPARRDGGGEPMTPKTTRSLIYLATPYSHPDPAVREARYRAACMVAARIMQHGDLVYIPIAHSHGIAQAGSLPGDFGYWEDNDRRVLAFCDYLAVAMLPGWETSHGIACEVEIMRALDKPVVYLQPEHALMAEPTPAGAAEMIIGAGRNMVAGMLGEYERMRREAKEAVAASKEIGEAARRLVERIDAGSNCYTEIEALRATLGLEGGPA